MTPGSGRAAAPDGAALSRGTHACLPTASRAAPPRRSPPRRRAQRKTPPTTDRRRGRAGLGRPGPKPVGPSGMPVVATGVGVGRSGGGFSVHPSSERRLECRLSGCGPVGRPRPRVEVRLARGIRVDARERTRTSLTSPCARGCPSPPAPASPFRADSPSPPGAGSREAPGELPASPRRDRTSAADDHVRQLQPSEFPQATHL